MKRRTKLEGADLAKQRKDEIAFRRESSFVKLLQTIAVAANEAAEIDEAMQVCLNEVCAVTGWPVGHVYFVDGEKLTPSKLWRLEEGAFHTFQQATEQTSFPPGIGLPGRVWSSGQAAWIIDVTQDTNFPRAPAALLAGLHAAFGFPVLIGTEVVAVLEFFAERAMEPDNHLMEVMAHIGTQLGRVVERKRSEEALQKVRDELDLRVQERTAELSSANTLLTVLYRIAQEAGSTSDLQEFYSAIHRSVSKLINARNFYIALYDKQTETVTFPYHVDDFDPDWEPRTKRKGLTEYVIRTGKSLLVTPEIFEALLRSGEVEVVISKRIDWIGVPLLSKEGTFGMLGVHTYLGDVRFNQRDLEILTFVSQQVASAIERKHAQEAQRRAEERFRQVVESAPNSMVMVDQTGRIILVNGMTEKLFGYQREELLKMGIEELVPMRYRHTHGRDRTHFFERAQARPMGAHDDLYALHKDGAEFPVEIGLNPIKAEQGMFVLAAIVDITERKKAVLELAERERLSRFGAEVGNALTCGDTLQAKLQQCAEALIRTQGDGIASVWTLRPGGQMLELQASAGKHANSSSPRKQVVVGQSWIGLVAKDREPLLIDLATAITAKEERTWAREAGMKSFAGYPLLFEDSLVGVLSVYSSHPLTPAALITMASVADEIAIGIHSDTAADALKRSEEKYRSLAERIPAITYIAEFGEMGRWFYVSPQLESTLGFTPEEWMADPGLYWSRMHPQDRSRVLGQENDSKYTRNTFVSEYRMTSRNGDILWFHDEGTVLEGNLSQGFMVDITERKRIEELKDELTSIVAHELRAPLTSILGSLEYLSTRSNQFNDREKQLLDMAGRNSERMLRLINDLLDIDKIESGKMIFDMKPVNLVAAVEHALEINQSYAAQFGVKLALIESLPGTVVLAEPDRLIQVLTNFLSNAAKFSPQNDVVEIRVLNINEAVRVAVTDHGQGIPEEFRNSIFQKFAQAESGHAKKGSGLGLSISKAIIEKMGGKIGFETKVGSGTNFYFDLPRTQ